MINDHLAYKYVETELMCTQLCEVLKAARWKLLSLYQPL